jgi:hypothetical protein
LKNLNFGHKPEMGSYKTNVDPDVVSLYADEKCKTCYGRGYLLMEIGTGNANGSTTIRKNRPVVQFLEKCSCVEKARKKYG